MDIKIKNSININGFSGPSQSYYETKERFKAILETKLNIPTVEVPSSSGDLGANDFMIDLLFQQSRSLGEISNYAAPINNPYANKLAENGLIASSNVREKSKVSASYIDSKLQGTALEGLGSAFKKAEEEHGVNALFLLGLAIHESNYGTSRIAKDKNNLFGFQAYDNSPYSSAKGFKSFDESIDTVAKYLSENYLQPDGKYFNGYSISSIGKKYATDPNWANGIENRIKKLIGM